MLFQSIGRLKQTMIIVAIVLISIGIISVLCPDPYIETFIDVFGFVLLIGAVVNILDFIESKKTLSRYIVFTIGLVLFLFGMAVLVFSDDILNILEWVFGILLILDGIYSMLYTLMYARRAGRRTWWLLVILAILVLAAGTIVIINPWWRTPEDLMDVFGLSLIFIALIGIIQLIYIWPLKNEK